MKTESARVTVLVIAVTVVSAMLPNSPNATAAPVAEARADSALVVSRFLDGEHIEAVVATPGSQLVVGTEDGAFELNGDRFDLIGDADACSAGDLASGGLGRSFRVKWAVAIGETIWLASENRLMRRTRSDACWVDLSEHIETALSGMTAIEDRVALYDGVLRTELGDDGEREESTQNASATATAEGGLLGPNGAVFTWSERKLRSDDGREQTIGGAINDVVSVDDRLVAASTGGLFSVSAELDGAPVEIASASTFAIATDSGGLLYATRTGLLRWERGRTVRLLDLAGNRISRPTSLTLDNEGSGWLGTTDGLVRVTLTNWSSPLGMPAESISSVAPPFAATVAEVFRIDVGGAEPLGCELDESTQINAVATSSTHLFVGTTQGIYSFGLDDPCSVGSRSLIGVNVEGFAVDASDRVWAHTAQRGLAFHRSADDDWLTFRLRNEEYSDLWFSAAGEMWATSSGGVAIVTVDGVDEVVAGLADHDGSGSPILGIGERRGPRDPASVGIDSTAGPLVAYRGCVVRFGATDCADPDAIEVRPNTYGVPGVVAMIVDEPRGAVWAATDDGLALLDLERPREFERFMVADGLVDDRINDVAVDESWNVWVATDRGLVVHRDAGIAPVLSRVDVDVDGSPCDRCLADGVPYGASKVAITPIGTDFADDVRATIEVTTNGKEVSPEADGFTFAVDEGRTYDIAIELHDQHFNLATPDDVVLRVARKPLSARVSEFLKNPLTYLVLLMAGAGAFAAFRLWRRSGRVRLVDASLRVGLIDGLPHAELELPRSVIGRLMKPKLVAFGGADSFELDAFDVESTSATHAQIAGASLAATVCGTQITKVLRRRLDRPTTVGIRLRLEFADDSAESLRSLPWELIGDADGPFDQRGLIVVRQTSEVEPVERTGLLKVLVARSTSTGDPLDQFDRQVESVRAAFSASAIPADVTVDDDITVERLEVKLSSTAWDVVHVYAHGGTDERGGFLMMSTDDGEHARIEADDLFANASGTPLLVTVAACRTSNPDSESGDVAGFAESLVLSGHSRSAIGFAHDIAQVALGDFSEAFYGELSKHRQVDVASQAGRAAISTGRLDQAAVRIYTGPRSGVLYERR